MTCSKTPIGRSLPVVLGDRGMGKTRLVQELYRRLTTNYDPQNYLDSVFHARQLAERVVGSSTSSRWVDWTARDALSRFANGEQNTGSLANTILERARKVVADTGTPESRGDLSISLDNVGRVAQARGQWAAAEEVYRESLGIRRALAQQLGTPQSRRDLGVSLLTLGLLALRPGDAPKGCGLLNEALPIFERLAEEIPTPQAKQDLEWTRRLLQEHCVGAAS